MLRPPSRAVSGRAVLGAPALGAASLLERSSRLGRGREVCRSVEEGSVLTTILGSLNRRDLEYEEWCKDEMRGMCGRSGMCHQDSRAGGRRLGLRGLRTLGRTVDRLLGTVAALSRGRPKWQASSRFLDGGAGRGVGRCGVGWCGVGRGWCIPKGEFGSKGRPVVGSRRRRHSDCSAHSERMRWLNAEMAMAMAMVIRQWQ